MSEMGDADGGYVGDVEGMYGIWGGECGGETGGSGGGWVLMFLYGGGMRGVFFCMGRDRGQGVERGMYVCVCMCLLMYVERRRRERERERHWSVWNYILMLSGVALMAERSNLQ